MVTTLYLISDRSQRRVAAGQPSFAAGILRHLPGAAVLDRLAYRSVLIAGAFWIFGATAWLIVGRPQRLSFLHRSSPYPAGGFGPQESLRRHPAAQASAGGFSEALGGVAFLAAPRPLGPDDDPDFLLELERRIRETREGSLLARPAGLVAWT